MKNYRYKVIPTLALSLALVLTACGSGTDSVNPQESAATTANLDAAAQAELDSLYQSAKDSGKTTVTLYTAYAQSDPNQGFSKVLRNFEKTYPGITVKESLYSGATLFSRVDGELASGKQEVDAVLSGPSDVGYFINKDALQPYVPTTAASVPANLKEPTGLYNVPFQSLFGLVYNTTIIKADEAPTSLEQVLADKYKGQVTFGQPVGTSPSSFSLTTLRYNDVLDEDQLIRLNQQVPIEDRYASVVDAVNAVAQGRYAIAIWCPSQVAAIQNQKGAPIAVGNLQDNRVLNGPGYGIFKNAPSADAAKLLETWLFTPAAQQHIADESFNYGTVAGSPAPPEFPSIADYTLKALPATEFAQELKADSPRWEAIFGPPKS